MTQWLRRNGFPEASKHTVDRLMRQERMNGLIGAAGPAPPSRARTAAVPVTC
ncbi:hypothetical protein FCN77_09500 [Arthrobacter sp. 24S4-2]|uniref:hypothetical protein n=1 Tax=Arthrobacter sp. 24S4-2 TaxID=2575374 RepID=UPI0010C7C3F0|nr:hypothetical protein FCN77_09500 [Arthrobacter sp. 24S4-2]